MDQLQSYEGFTGLHVQGGLFTWMAGFSGSSLRAQLGLSTGACTCSFFLCLRLLHSMATSEQLGFLHSGSGIKKEHVSSCSRQKLYYLRNHKISLFLHYVFLQVSERPTQMCEREIQTPFLMGKVYKICEHSKLPQVSFSVTSNLKPLIL